MSRKKGMISHVVYTVSIRFRFNIVFHRSISKSSSSGPSYAIDDLQSEKRFLPKQYKKLKNKMNQSFTKMKQKLGIKPKNWGRGDGLHSIYSGSLFNLHSADYSLQTVDMNEVRSDILDASQSMAFNALFTLGIFEGAELSILNELCSNAIVMRRKKNEFLFKHDSPNSNDFLYVLKSGTCNVIFPKATIDEAGKNTINKNHDVVIDNETDDLGGDVVVDITSGLVVASVADVLAWLIRSGTTRRISVHCKTECEFVVSAQVLSCMSPNWVNCN